MRDYLLELGGSPETIGDHVRILYMKYQSWQEETNTLPFGEKIKRYAEVGGKYGFVLGLLGGLAYLANTATESPEEINSIKEVVDQLKSVAGGTMAASTFLAGIFAAFSSAEYIVEQNDPLTKRIKDALQQKLYKLKSQE